MKLTGERGLPAFGDVATGTVTTVRKAGAELDLDTGTRPSCRSAT